MDSFVHTVREHVLYAGTVLLEWKREKVSHTEKSVSHTLSRVGALVTSLYGYAEAGAGVTPNLI